MAQAHAAREAGEMILSLIVLTGGILAAPYATGLFLKYTGADKLGAIIFMVCWLWTYTYWGMVWHAREVGALFARIMDG